MAIFALVAIVYQAWAVGAVLFSAILTHHPEAISEIMVEILTVFILVEVLGVSVRFMRANRIDVRDLVDVTLAIIFREIWVGMFSGAVHWQELIALAALTAVLGGLRLLMTRQRGLGIAESDRDPE